MIHKLKHTLLPAHNHVIDSGEMLRVFWKADTAAVRYDGDLEFGGHEEDGEDFVDAAHAAGVYLADVDRAGGQKLLEHDAVLAHFAGSDSDIVGF